MNNSLYEITSQYLTLLDAVKVDEETGEVTGLEELEAAEDDLSVKAESIALYIKDIVFLADSLKKEIDTLTERKRAAEARAERIKEYLAYCLARAGREKFETARCVVSFRKSQKLNITDENAIPMDFLIHKESVSPDKTAIKAAIKSGMVVPGAEILDCKNIQIR